MIKRFFISLFILIVLWIMSRIFLVWQYSIWDFNTEEDYKSYNLNVEEILEMRENLK